MKILAIDDQQLVLLPLKKKLLNFGYDVVIETDALKGIRLFDSFEPDLVLLDLNMPHISGIEIVKHIRKEKNSDVPIMVLSGNTDDQTIASSYQLGVDDFMKKPLSLSEICIRVARLIGAPKTQMQFQETGTVMIQNRCVGLVIPCFNEAKRLSGSKFLSFIDENAGYHLCFVNDGSTDNTLEVLAALRKGREAYISVYNLDSNRGKAEAVRAGVLHMSKFEGLDYIGFLDADLSTNLSDFDDLVTTIEDSKYKVVSGSRISRMGATISRKNSRKLATVTINFFIRVLLSMDFKDTQCGAKIFHKDVIELLFKEQFVSKWLFDVELFMRMKRHFKIARAKELICEKPLTRWVHVDGSKLTLKDSLKIFYQIVRIHRHYKKYTTTVCKENFNQKKEAHSNMTFEKLSKLVSPNCTKYASTKR